ncbi:hypothetical protein [Streptomyces sp. NPDC088812]|uniref:hypothetical protein n=1 Tax=Streptomyces sp. NPDC088812 TaxID=3365905 RepID=UPI0038093F55
MANTTPPPPPGFPPPLPPQPPAPPKKSRTNAIIIGSAAAVIAAVVVTGVVVAQASGDGDSKPASTTAAESSAPVGDAVTAAAEEESAPVYAELGVDSFTIELRTTERQCFGSAGCNVTVEPDLTYTGIEDIDPDAVYDITYEIHGDESGTVIETAELSNQTSLNYTPTSISTASSSTKVTVEITDVVAQGG